MSDTPVPPPAAPSGEDKTVALLAYLTPLLCLVGFVIAVLMHNKAKTQLGAYHLRQVLGLLIVSIAGGIVFFVLGIIVGFMAGIPAIGFILVKGVWLLNMLFSLGMLALWIMGLVSAINSEQKPVPVLGKIAQEKLAGVFV